MSYYSGADFITDGADTTTWGLGAVQSFDDLSLDVYAALLQFAYDDDTGVDYEDASGLLVGARWFF